MIEGGDDLVPVLRNVDWKVDLDKNAAPSSKTAWRNASNCGRCLSVVDAFGVFDPLLSLLCVRRGGFGMEGWAGSSVGRNGVRRTRLPGAALVALVVAIVLCALLGDGLPCKNKKSICEQNNEPSVSASSFGLVQQTRKVKHVTKIVS